MDLGIYNSTNTFSSFEEERGICSIQLNGEIINTILFPKFV